MVDLNLIAAIVFLLIGITGIIKNITGKIYFKFFWFCDFVPFLLAISFFFNFFQFIQALINMGLLTQVITLVMLLTGFIFNKDLAGSKKALARGKFYVTIELLIHFTIILALLFTLNIQPKLESLIYSFVLIVIMFFLTLIFTSKEKNINLLYDLGISLKNNSENLRFPFHTSLWIIYYSIVSIITFFIQYRLYLIWRP